MGRKGRKPLFLFNKLFFLEPRLLEIIRRLIAVSSMGLSPPRQDLCRPPSLRDPRSGAVTGRKYHCPLCLSSPPPEAIRVLLIGWLARPPKRSLRALSAWLGAHHPGPGNVSDECVFSCQCEKENKSPQYSDAEKIRKTATLFQKYFFQGTNLLFKPAILIKSDDYCKAEAWPQNGHELRPKQAKRPKTAPFSAFSIGKM